MILLLIALIVGWVVLSSRQALAKPDFSGTYWTLLTLGTVFLAMVLVGVVLYIALSVKAINLTRRQSNFIDSVTHELKSPIASLKLYLQTVSRRTMNDSERAGFHRSMLEDVDRLDGLIDHLLDVARLDRRPSEDEQEEVELAPVLRKTAEMVCFRYRLPASTVRLDGEPVVVRGLPFDMDLVFSNLIDNAVKHAGASPEVAIETQPGRAGWVVTRIRDNGATIPAEHRRRIFGRFVRVGAELEREHSGTGLGLHIVRSLVRRMKGRITIREREDRPGNVFEVHLPGRPAAAQASPALPAAR
jgi:signal transduction histidine kinase